MIQFANKYLSTLLLSPISVHLANSILSWNYYNIRSYIAYGNFKLWLLGEFTRELYLLEIFIIIISYFTALTNANYN